MFDSRQDLATRRAAGMVLSAVVMLAASACGGGGSSGGVRESNDPGIPTQPPPSDPSPGTQHSAPQPEPAPEPAPQPEPEPEPEPEPTLTPADFETLEYDRGRFLPRINAADAYASNGIEPVSGAGIVVAVIDTGVDVTHPEFAGRIAPGGRMFLTAGDPTEVRDLDPGGHGTHVAGIIGAAKDDRGMHGVAWGASILPISYGEGLVRDRDLAEMFSHAQTMGARVYNNSWSMSHDIDDFASKNALEAFIPRTAAALRSIAADHGVIVFAAGNDAAPNPQFWGRVPELLDELRGVWMTVVAVNGSGTLASYSNACGDTLTATWCLAAPGGSGGARIVSTLPGGGYGEKTGTSMAAPVVAGSVAVLMEKFPTLNGSQVVERIFHTADKAGIYANTTLYGQGLLDLGAAASPVGGLFVPLSTSIHGEVAPLGSVGLGASPAEAARLREALAGQSFLAVDGFQRAPFRLDAAHFVAERTLDRELLADRIERRAGRVELGTSPALAGYRQRGGTERIVSAVLPAATRLSIAADAPFGALAQAMAPLALTPDGARNLFERRQRAEGRALGLGFGRDLGSAWQAGVSAWTGDADGRAQAFGAQLGRRLGDTSIALSLSQHTVRADREAGRHDFGISAANARYAAERSSLASLLAWRPDPVWELYSELEFDASRTHSRAGDHFALRREAQRASATFGATRRIGDGNLALTTAWRVSAAPRTALSVTVPEWVHADGSVTRKTARTAWSDPLAHALGLHLAGTLDRKERTRFTLAFTRDTRSGTEATATLNRAF